jgi:hypothetical protein
VPGAASDAMVGDFLYHFTPSQVRVDAPSSGDFWYRCKKIVVWNASDRYVSPSDTGLNGLIPSANALSRIA